MKTTFTALFLIAIVVLFMATKQSFAQTTDTVVVSANPPGNPNGGPLINDFIIGDTTATGQRKDPNRVYVLQQTGPVDTVYYFTSTMYTKFNITIIGKINPTTGMPPVIAPFPRADNSTPTQFIYASRGKITLKGLYFLGALPGGQAVTHNVVQTSGDSVTVVADHCVFDNFYDTFLFAFMGNHSNIFMTNCEVRNIQGPSWQGGGVFWSLFGVSTDTAKFVNNTFFCLMRQVVGTPAYIGYFLFDHNTMFLGVGEPLRIPQMTNAIIRNNIFYGVFAHGADSAQIKGNLFQNDRQGPAIIMLDTLTTLRNPPYNFKEADRKVVVENNDYFWPKALYDNWRKLSDTASASGPGIIVPPSWMTNETSYMFSQHAKWPGFVESNNDSLDPGFSPSLVGPAVDSLIKFVNITWVQGSGGAFRWSQLPGDPVTVFQLIPKNWSVYPVPENLRYSNTALQTAGTDGKALGDLNWYPEQLISGVQQMPNSVPTKFDLSQNYPNPFNPTTTIAYSIPRGTFVSLKVFNVLGQEVATLYNGFQKAGSYKVDFDASKLSSGVYLYRLQSNSYAETKKMILMK